MIPLPWLLLIVLVLVGGAGAGGFYKGRKYEEGRQAVRIAIEDRVAEAAEKGAAKAVVKVKVERVTIHERTEKEIERIPAECVAPDSLHDITNEAITGIAPAGDRELPAPDSDAG